MNAGRTPPNKNFSLLLSKAAIATIVERLAAELDEDYKHKAPVLVGNLKGSFIFLADLVRHMKIPIHDIEFVRVTSYGPSTTSSRRTKALIGIPPFSLMGQHVILIEDIIDTGLTMSATLNHLRQFMPASLKVCTLLDKPSRRQTAIPIDYLGATVPNRFVVGYGLDFNEEFRQLPEIYTLKEA